VSRSGATDRVARLAVRAVLVALAVLAVLCSRAAIGARDEFGLAQRARQAGDVDTAVVHARRALRWYVPFDPVQHEALEMLLELARDAERSGDEARARRARQAVLAATAASRSFFVPHCDARVEAARARAGGFGGVVIGAGDPCRLGAGVFATDADPSGVAIALAGLVAALSAAWRLASRLDSGPRRGSAASRGRLLAVVLCGLVAFALGLAIA
jgi:hypothetical protein